MPERTSSQHPVAIQCQPLLPFFQQSLPPLRALGNADFPKRPNYRPQHVKVMHLAEGILQGAQVPRPLLVTPWQEILDHVAKAFYADPKPVITGLAAIAQC